jgi:hypothetical protein
VGYKSKFYADIVAQEREMKDEKERVLQGKQQ